MHYRALAVDYDGTLAGEGRVAPATFQALQRLADKGCTLLLVTGRELGELKEVFPGLGVFHGVVAENGALLYRPSDQHCRRLGPAPPPSFLAALAERGVPFSAGSSIVATVQPYEDVVVEIIGRLGLELNVVFNKGAVMVLPEGLNKATGLAHALRERGLSPHNTVAVGDGENDHAMLAHAGFGVAVANAVPALKQAADFTTAAPNGAGVIEVIEAILRAPERPELLRPRRRTVSLGAGHDGSAVLIPAAAGVVLIAGPPADAASATAAGIVEQLIEQDYQCCIIESRSEDRWPRAVRIGEPSHRPDIAAVLAALAKPDTSVAVNLQGVPAGEQRQFVADLAPRLHELRLRSGRPHWIFVDEADRILPRPAGPAWAALADPQAGLLCAAGSGEGITAQFTSRFDVAGMAVREPR